MKQAKVKAFRDTYLVYYLFDKGEVIIKSIHKEHPSGYLEYKLNKLGLAQKIYRVICEKEGVRG